jgi:uncharacterized protein YdaU (DUF1376 family)
MAKPWQQWMPFYIDRFRGSPDVQAMHPIARIGYLYMLASAWQTEDCTLQNDLLDLASISGLGDELWAQYSARILRKFETTEDGRLRNRVLFQEWSSAKRIFDARSEAAKQTTAKRSANGDRSGDRSGDRTVTEAKTDGDRAKTERSADTITGTLTGTETNTGTEKPSTLALTSVEVPAGGVFELPLPGIQGEWQVPQKLYEEMVQIYPDVGVMKQLARMRGHLVANPSKRKTHRGLPRFINSWLAREQDDSRQRGGNNNGGSNGKTGAEEHNGENFRRILGTQPARQDW